MKVNDLNRDQLMVLARETYDKEQWSAGDVCTLRACWEEFETSGIRSARAFLPAHLL